MSEYSESSNNELLYNNLSLSLYWLTNRICHRSPMQIEKSQPEGKWIMPETSFMAYSVDLRVGISQSASGQIFD